MRMWAGLAFTIGLAVAGTSTPAIASVLDQSNLGLETFGGGVDSGRAQTFTVGISGVLEEVSLGLATFSATGDGSFTINIFDPSANKLLASVPLAASLVPYSDPGSLNEITTKDLTPVDLSSFGINVVAGQVLGIGILQDVPGGNPGYFGTYGIISYTGGAVGFYSAPTGFAPFGGNDDMAFQTFVQPVPEPATVGLLALGVGALVGVSHKKRIQRAVACG